MFKILFFGDIVGKLGRQALVKTLPTIKKKHKPDLVIANVENLAHGFGVTVKTLNEIRAAGVDFFTSGNHIFKNNGYEEVLADPDLGPLLIRPANYPPGTPGVGEKVVRVAEKSVLVVNLMGRVFFKEQYDDPFRGLDAILANHTDENLAAIIVDFHAEATSEKYAFGWYADGRVSAVLGTHTQVASADWRILPGGTAYVTDAGPVAGRHGIIGFKKEGPLAGFLKQRPQHFEVLDEGPAEVNGVLVTIDPKTRQAIKIDKIWQEVII